MAADINASSLGTTAATGAELDADGVVDVVEDLLENARDGEYGFWACGDEVDSAELKQVFRDRASVCMTAAGELAQVIQRYGGKVDDGGSVSGAIHRGRVHMKCSLGTNSELSMLEECERGEDAAVARYRKALKESLPADVRALAGC